MEASDKDLILFTVIASSSVVLLLVAIVFDIFLIYRKRKIINRQEIELREKKIDELIRKQEVESVNAILKGQNTERRRISQELHDRLGSILYSAKLHNQSIEKKLKEIAQEQKEGFSRLTTILDEAVEEVRKISHDLYEGSLAKFGYSVALKQLISALREANGIEINFNYDRDLDDCNESIQFELYAITQEMLSNTLKHAKATQIEITIRVEDALDYTYRDNGTGFDLQEVESGIGIENIKSRSEKLNAELSVESARGKGVFYHLTIPKS